MLSPLPGPPCLQQPGSSKQADGLHTTGAHTRTQQLTETSLRSPCTAQVVKEVLRYRPPAPMVPQIAQQPFKLTEDYTAPKGAMIIPSVWAACMQVWKCDRGPKHSARA